MLNQSLTAATAELPVVPLPVTLPPVVELATTEPLEMPPRSGRRRGRYAWLLALPPALLTLVIGGYRAGERQLWEDEYATWHAATLGYPDFSRLMSNIDLVLSPYYLLMHGWATVFGDSPLALRAPSVLAMALTAGLVVQLGRRLFTPSVALIAGLLFVTVPSISRYAQEARPYALAMLLAVLATVLLVRAIDRPTWPQWLLYGLALILLGLAHVVALSILVAHLVAIRNSERNRDVLRVWRWLAPAIASIALIGPFALAAAAQSDAISWIKADRAALRSFPLRLFGSGTIALVIVALAIAAIFLLVRSAGPQLAMLTAWAIGPPVVTFVTFPALHLFEFRYLLFTLPAWVLLAAAGIDALGRAMAASKGAASGRRRLAVLVVAILALPTVGWLSIPGQLDARRDPAIGTPDYREAARLIRADLRPGDAIAYGGRNFLARRGMAYEMRGTLRPRDVFLDQSAERRGRFTAAECPLPATCLGGTRRIWLVNTAKSADILAELPPLTAALLENRFTIVDRTELVHLHVALFVINDLPR